MALSNGWPRGTKQITCTKNSRRGHSLQSKIQKTFSLFGNYSYDQRSKQQLLNCTALTSSHPVGATVLYFDSWNHPTKVINQDQDFLLALDFAEPFYNHPEWQGDLKCTTSLTRLRSPCTECAVREFKVRGLRRPEKKNEWQFNECLGRHDITDWLFQCSFHPIHTPTCSKCRWIDAS